MNDDFPHLLFAYGSLKSGQSNHGLIRHGVFVGHGWTRHKYSLGGWGKFAFAATTPALYPIHGEVWAVCEKTLKHTDDLENHPVTYVRKKTEVLLPEGGIEVWIYLGQTLTNREPYPFGLWPEAALKTRASAKR